MHREIMMHRNRVILKIYDVQRNTGSTNALLVECTVIWLNKKHLRNNAGLCQNIYFGTLHCIMCIGAHQSSNMEHHVRVNFQI
jgi:hypothetical protein